MSGLHKAPAPAKSKKITGSGIKVPPKPPGFHTTTREPKRAHLTPPALQTLPKFHEKTPRERRKERIMRQERGKKKSAKFWVPTLAGTHFVWVWDNTLRAPPPSWPQLFMGLGPWPAPLVGTMLCFLEPNVHACHG